MPAGEGLPAGTIVCGEMNRISSATRSVPPDYVLRITRAEADRIGRFGITVNNSLGRHEGLDNAPFDNMSLPALRGHEFGRDFCVERL